MGANILTTGRIDIYVDKYRDALLDIKENTIHNSEDKLNQLNEHYLNLFNQAYKKSVLPDNADIHSLDNWLEFVYGLNVGKSGFLFNKHLEKK